MNQPDLPPGQQGQEQAGYDAIVIGSGMGGLACAATLARAGGQRVLVLEQHFKAGGQTHIFKRKDHYFFDVGVHYLGGMAPGKMVRACFDWLSRGKLKWAPLPPSYDVFHYPGLVFPVGPGRQGYGRALAEAFPQEKAAIGRYLKDLERAAFWTVFHSVIEELPKGLRPLGRLAFALRGALARQTTQHYLERRFADGRLRALAASQWGDYGEIPQHSAFGMHALLVTHYLEGAWYPQGGASSIAKGVMPQILEAGGQVRLNCRVERILMEGGRAVGVKTANPAKPEEPPQYYYAPAIISDAGARNSYLKLLEPAHQPPFAQALKESPWAPTALILFLGLKESPEKLGLKGENRWVYRDFSHPDNQGGFDRGDYFLSVASLRDPAAQAHTAEVVMFCGHQSFAPWEETGWKERPPGYEKMKEALIKRMLAQVERDFPGFTALVDYQELSTPLSMKHFIQGERGAFYGVPFRPERFNQPWARARTPIPGLWLTGQDVVCCGVTGAMMGGLKTASLVLGKKGGLKLRQRILAEGKKEGR